ncbi:MAG: glycoside hydrolase family 32 protein [Atopobiaceae bacterium]|nr:glycoside hydrolase family 32 protein [Atopobiaceae bacterium]
MPKESWETSFHLHPQTAWMNDPNGLCFFRGVYHAFYQYAPDWPADPLKHWGHATSTDLLHWNHESVALSPSVPEDTHGVFSGCTQVISHGAADGGEQMLVYYTGNVICPSPNHNPRDKSFVFAGREGNTILVTSDDGMDFSDKEVLLHQADYPDELSCHVRDPKVWEQDGSLHMVLGARSLRGAGCVLVYDSTDGRNWTYRHTIRSEYSFGYMWECPGIVQLEGREFLMISPQGLPRLSQQWKNLWQSGYIALDTHLLETQLIDETRFVEWDRGHDFYAPQTFIDEHGRTILIGWMGSFDERLNSTPDGLSWCHCFTLPRELTLNERGRICQNPISELADVRAHHRQLELGTTHSFDSPSVDIECLGISGAGSLLVNHDVELRIGATGLGQATVELVYLDAQVAQGRENRRIELDEDDCWGDFSSGFCGLNSLRLILDGSTLELYLNDGAVVMSSRWFSRSDARIEICMDIPCQQASGWELCSSEEQGAHPVEQCA